jgi:hypothetical protein
MARSTRDLEQLTTEQILVIYERSARSSRLRVGGSLPQPVPTAGTGPGKTLGPSPPDQVAPARATRPLAVDSPVDKWINHPQGQQASREKVSPCPQFR